MGDVNATVVFQPLRTRRLSEVIEDHIRELILTEQVKQGDRLPTEKELGRQFGVSLVTVREALRGLEAFGIIEKKRGKDGGVFVSSMSGNSVKTVLHSFLHSQNFSAAHLREVRAAVEPAVMKLAAPRMTEELLKALRENIAHCEARLSRPGSGFTSEDFFDIEEHSVEFHRLIAEATGNPVLIFMVDYVMDFLLSFTRRLALSFDRRISARTVADHRRIVRLLEAGDASAAEAAMVGHIARTGGYLVDKEAGKGHDG